MEVFKNPLFHFILKATGLYVLWFLLYELWLHPNHELDLWVIDNIIQISTNILEFVGYVTIHFPYDKFYRTLGVDGTVGVWVGDSCNGLSVVALFSGFIIAFPGDWRKKLLYIPFGIITIHLLNIIRISLLAIILKHAPETLEFNHTYTFTTLLYTYVFLMWYFWATKYSTK